MFENTIDRLREGNKMYLRDRVCAEMRRQTASGQRPYAVILTCADSRVIPEAIFDAGIGELFVIRVAGNIPGRTQLASVEYAVHHLGVKTVVVLGHTNCGAVGAALAGEFEGLTGEITREIGDAIGNEHEPLAACKKNVEHGIKTVKEQVHGTFDAVGAVYDIETGEVEFLK